MSEDSFSPEQYRELLYELEDIEDWIKLKKNHEDIVESIRELTEFVIWSEQQNGSYFE